mgnify:FL=1
MDFKDNITLYDFFQILLNSKIRIIVVSLMFSSISIFYVFSQESIYQSEVTITVGRYYLSDDIELKYKTRDKHISMAEAINSYFDSVLIDRKGRYIYKIQTRGNSKDATHKSLEKVIAFFFDFDKKKIDYKISLDQKAISDLNEMIHLEKNELNTLSKSQNLSASLIQYASELNL